MTHNADDIIYNFLMKQANDLEQQILKKGELLDLFMDIQKANPHDMIVTDQIAMLTTDLKNLIGELLKLRQDSEFTNPETQGVIDKMGNIKPITHEKLVENIKGKYYWQEDF
jgi:hypothetical protein